MNADLVSFSDQAENTFVFGMMYAFIDLLLFLLFF